jgi:hypothetical protein
MLIVVSGTNTSDRPIPWKNCGQAGSPMARATSIRLEALTHSK